MKTSCFIFIANFRKFSPKTEKKNRKNFFFRKRGLKILGVGSEEKEGDLGGKLHGKYGFRDHRKHVVSLHSVSNIFLMILHRYISEFYFLICLV